MEKITYDDVCNTLEKLKNQTIQVNQLVPITKKNLKFFCKHFDEDYKKALQTKHFKGYDLIIVDKNA